MYEESQPGSPIGMLKSTWLKLLRAGKVVGMAMQFKI